MKQSGSIEVIYGPMFSGKSSQLLRKIRRYQIAKKKCVVINYLHDNRYSDQDQMATHDRITKKAFKTATLLDKQEKFLDYDVVGIDEGQFFGDIVEFCQFLASKSVKVIIAALDGTFERKPFGNILNLIPLAQKISKLNAVCVYCTEQAPYTKRIVASKEIQLIGGQEMYKPVCRTCFFLEESIIKESPEETQEETKIEQKIQEITEIKV